MPNAKGAPGGFPDAKLPENLAKHHARPCPRRTGPMATRPGVRPPSSASGRIRSSDLQRFFPIHGEERLHPTKKPATMLPGREGETVAGVLEPRRKVRAPQGGVLDNVQRGRPQGKCHRKDSARQVRVSVKWCGKSAPGSRRRESQGKPHPEQDRIGMHVPSGTIGGPPKASGLRSLEGVGNGAPR